MKKHEVKVGTLVWYYPVTKGHSPETDLLKKKCIVATEPWQLGSGAWVVHLNSSTTNKRVVHAALLYRLEPVVEGE